MFALALLLFCAAAVQGEETVKCTDLKDSDCTTLASRYHDKEAAQGKQGEWDSSYELYKDEIEGTADALQYKLTDVYLRGMDTCATTLLQLDPESLAYHWTVFCTGIKTEYNWNFDGSVSGLDLTGQGTGESSYNQYDIGMNGKYEIYTDESGAEHLKLQVPTFEFSSKNKDVTHKLQGLSEEKNQALNEKYEEVKVITDNCLGMVMPQFIVNTNGFLKYYSIDFVFSYDPSADVLQSVL